MGSSWRILRKAALSVPRVRRFYDNACRIQIERDGLKRELASVRSEQAYLMHFCEQVRVKVPNVDHAADLNSEFQALMGLIRTGGFASAHQSVIELIKSGKDLDSPEMRNLVAAVEFYLTQPGAAKIEIHREIGKAIFARSVDLYRGIGLPSWLTRFTYPATLGIALNTHCNAACFFCREADYKGVWVEFREVEKLEKAIRHARVIDLTGWGEPFLYSDFERVVESVLRLNSSPQSIQITSNGSLLTRRWGELLAGHINLFVISLNAATQETHDQQMRYKSKNITFERVLNNLRQFLPALTEEDRKRIDLHMVANSDNYTEISQFVAIAAELGIAQVSIGYYISAQKQYMQKTLWNVKKEYNRALERGRNLGAALGVVVHGRKFFTNEEKILGAEKCMAPFEQIMIETTGKTAPCCFMGNERIENVYRDGFDAVWFSDVMNKLRKDRYLPPCKVCTVFSPFDDKTTHISGTLLTEATLPTG
jgi:MoaA/NifB/PqqE/SkfB family radical SAM enzyme